MISDRPEDPKDNGEALSPVELLYWYKHAGIDIALGDQPVDQFAASKIQAQAARSPAPAIKQGLAAGHRPGAINPGISARASHRPANPQPNNAMSAAAIPDEVVVSDAREKAKSAASLGELREIMSAFKGCNLHLSAKNMVFGDGDPTSGIMLIGEAPGRDEDLHGLPFVGRSGQLLERMLAAINLERNSVYITNVIPWRPPGNRTPTPLETEICRPFIERHIDLVNPKIMVLLGGAAAKVLLNSTQGILKMRGRWNKFGGAQGEIDVMPTLHPAYLLRQPAQKKLAWQDLLKIREKISASQ